MFLVTRTVYIHTNITCVCDVKAQPCGTPIASQPFLFGYYARLIFRAIYST